MVMLEVACSSALLLMLDVAWFCALLLTVLEDVSLDDELELEAIELEALFGVLVKLPAMLLLLNIDELDNGEVLVLEDGGVDERL